MNGMIQTIKTDTHEAWELPSASNPASQRRLSKLAFVGRLGADYRNVLVAAKANVDVEMFVKQLDWATPEADGTSVDLDDPRVVFALTTMETAGVISAGRTATVLA